MQDFSAPPMPEQADSNGIQDLSRGILSFRDSQLRDLDQLSAWMLKMVMPQQTQLWLWRMATALFNKLLVTSLTQHTQYTHNNTHNNTQHNARQHTTVLTM